MGQQDGEQVFSEKQKVVEEITRLNCFSKLYSEVRRLKTSKHINVMFIIALVTFSAFNTIGSSDVSLISGNVVTYSTSLIGWSVSILGFILAGYSIYSTLTDKELNLALASVEQPVYGMSYLAYTHAVFIKVIIEITAVCLIAYIIQVFVDSSLFYFFLKEGSGCQYFTCSTAILLSTLQALFVYVLMSCLVFIYNVYHSIMTSIRWYAEQKLNEDD